MTPKENQTNINIQEKANMIWSIADIIRGTFKPHEYGRVILPMTLLKRLNDTLLPTKQAVLDKYEEVKDFEVKGGFLKRASGYSFYNISQFTFENLLNESEHIEENFKAFIGGFSENIQDVLENFEFNNIIKRLRGKTQEEDKLFYVIQEFNKPSANMDAKIISATDMGYIFEELVRKFSESYNEEAGAHFTARDIIYTMTDLLIAEEKDFFSNEGINQTVYDMTMGTSQMLTCMEERLNSLDSDAEVTVYGQEFNPETYAIAKADMIIRDGNSSNMRFGDTLTNDQFEGYKFSKIISNPPFGVEWKAQQSKVKLEHESGDKGRFAPGLPKISDGQLLFTLNGISKLEDDGRMAIIHNGSPLFTGDAGSGPSNIRKYIIENDLLEAIVRLPNDLFYNTAITTYIWILAKCKTKKRVGKVQLIDASKMYKKRRKSLGYKRVEMDKECREAIVKAYGDFRNELYEYTNKSVESKVFLNEEFGYYKVIVESPQIDANGNIVLKKGKPIADSKQRDTENISMIPGKEQNEVINNYYHKEIKSYNSDAWIDEKKVKIGYEIPFTRLFYKYVSPENSKIIADRIKTYENELTENIKTLFESVGN